MFSTILLLAVTASPLRLTEPPSYDIPPPSTIGPYCEAPEWFEWKEDDFPRTPALCVMATTFELDALINKCAVSDDDLECYAQYQEIMQTGEACIKDTL